MEDFRQDAAVFRAEYLLLVRRGDKEACGGNIRYDRIYSFPPQALYDPMDLF